MQQRILSFSLRFWTLFIGIGAVLGAAMMWIDPSGEMWGMGPLLAMLQQSMPWPDIFFRNFVFSGFVLLAVNGLTQLVAAGLVFRHHRWAEVTVALCGIILMLWIVLEWVIFGFNALSNIYFAFGLLETVTAMLAKRKKFTII